MMLNAECSYVQANPGWYLGNPGAPTGLPFIEFADQYRLTRGNIAIK